MRVKTDGGKETMLKISQFSPRGGCLCAVILPYSLQFDSQVRNFKKEDTFRHDMQLSDRQDFPRSSRNLDQKTTLRQEKNTLAASIRGTASRRLKLYFSQDQNFKKEGIASFPRTPRTLKTDVRSYVNHTCKN